MDLVAQLVQQLAEQHAAQQAAVEADTKPDRAVFVSPTAEVITLAGTGGIKGFKAGKGTAVQFNWPGNLTS